MAHVDPDALALLALGDGDQTEQDTEHLSSCAHCHDELRRLTEIVAIARDAKPDRDLRLEAPADGLFDRITSELGLYGGIQAVAELTNHGAPTQGAVARPSPHATRSRWWRRPVAGLAAGLLLGAASAVVGEQVSRDIHSEAASSTTQLSPLPQFPQWRAARATATLTTGTGGPVISITLDAAPGPGFFEVWLLGRNGRSMISLGDLSKHRTGRFSLPPGVNLRFYSRIDISLQPFNGSPVHSAISVVRGHVPRA
jgi:hypothetical protein